MATSQQVIAEMPTSPARSIASIAGRLRRSGSVTSRTRHGYRGESRARFFASQVQRSGSAAEDSTSAEKRTEPAREPKRSGCNRPTGSAAGGSGVVGVRCFRAQPRGDGEERLDVVVGEVGELPRRLGARGAVRRGSIHRVESGRDCGGGRTGAPGDGRRRRRRVDGGVAKIRDGMSAGQGKGAYELVSVATGGRPGNEPVRLARRLEGGACAVGAHASRRAGRGGAGLRAPPWENDLARGAAARGPRALDHVGEPGPPKGRAGCVLFCGGARGPRW